MPVINVSCSKLSKEQKKNLVQLLTKASKKVIGDNGSHIVLINEYDTDAIGVNGQTLEEMNK